MFDQIVCTGVLHHLPDPDIGLQSLRGVLAPNGAMHLMVYATYGRAGIYMIAGVLPAARRRRVGGRVAGPRHHDRCAVCRPSDRWCGRGGRRISGHPDALADALLHPQDRAYTVPQLYAWLERCGLSFGRWFEQAPYLPQCGAMAGTPYAERLVSLSPQLQHAAVELLRGTMTKHNFIAYRDDRLGESQPITFDGDAWRGYVPLRLPWTLCILDRLPPGSAAVLINRAHTYPDLALPINAAQERVFAAIDGNRSIDEILRGAAGAIGDERGPQVYRAALGVRSDRVRHDELALTAAFSVPRKRCTTSASGRDAKAHKQASDGLSSGAPGNYAVEARDLLNLTY